MNGAVMTKHAPWFFQERAAWFAKVVLTRRPDVVVGTYAGTDMGIDLLVEVLKDGKSTRRFFGVQLVADMDLPNVKDANGRVRSHLGRDSFEAELPVCAFVIGVRKPEGIYRWVVEPAVDNGRPLLRRDAETRWHALDEAGVDRLIDQVDAWYDARKERSNLTLHGRHSQSAP